MSSRPDTPPAVVVDGVDKVFRLPHEASSTLKERVLHPRRSAATDRLQALRDISFEVAPGEFFGIVGRNGSGKSTLLKCLAGIYRTDRGRIAIDGRLSPFIELGVGFNQDLAARDNVITNAIMLGLSPRDARAVFDAVIEFAELEQFTELKLKNYSSGMMVRLAFSVAVHAHAEILLIDEVLAVGDAAFQQKCFDVFNTLRDEGRTILFVTHDMASVTRFCNRALLLEHGEMVLLDEPGLVAGRYEELNFSSGATQQDPGDGGLRTGDGSGHVVDSSLQDDSGRPVDVVAQGQTVTLRLRVRFARAVEHPSFGVAFVNEHHQNQFVATTLTRTERTGRFAAGEEVDFSVTFQNLFAPGRYQLSVQIAHRGGGMFPIDRWERMRSVLVTATRASGGLVDLPYELRLERVAGPSGAGEQILQESTP